jgi:hypothetical protein
MPVRMHSQNGKERALLRGSTSTDKHEPSHPTTRPRLVPFSSEILSLLSQYRLCAAGIGLGTAYSLRYKKGVIPMVAAGAIGSTADMVYGYLVECSQFRELSRGNDVSSSTGGNQSD